MANISDFKSQLIGGGARPNQFRVELTFPTFVGIGGLVGLNAQFLCKAAQLPASTINNIETFYRGRPVNFAGERTFSPWAVSIYNDTTFSIRNAMEVWSDGVINNSRTNGITNPRDYQVDMLVHQLDRNGAIVKTYKFVDAYPTNIGAIGLDYESNNQIEIFDVEFTYNYWTSNTSSGGSGFGITTTVDTPLGSFPLNI
jgi:hypothetical protein